MNAQSEVVEGSVKAIADKLPVEDIWTLNANTAKECQLDTEPNFVIIVPDAEDPLEAEAEVHRILAEAFPGETIGAYVFPQSAIERTPRPLLVKMALSSGRKVYTC